MMWARLLLLLAAFQLEVRVRANSDAEPLWHPEGCAKSKTECHVQVGTLSLPLPSVEGRIDAAADSIFEGKRGAWKILKGAVRVRETELETVYGRLEKGAHEAWILAEANDRVVVRAVDGVLHFKTRDDRVLEVPEGLELWIGSVDGNGRSLHGVPTEIPVSDHLRRWARMDRLSPSKLKELTVDLRERWKGRELVASALYDQVAKRRLASVAEAERAEAKKREDAKQERDHYRRMLHRTAFEK